mgnify:FL=1
MDIETSELTHWCHSDAAMVAVTQCADGSGELECSLCGSRFVEILEADSATFIPHEVPMTGATRARTRARSRTLSAGSDDGTVRTLGGAPAFPARTLLGGGGSPMVQVLRMPGGGAGGAGAGNPAEMMQGMLQQLLGGLLSGQGGGVRLGGGGLGAAGLPGGLGMPTRVGGATTVGDYALGNMSELIAQLMQNDPNRHAAAPAAAGVVQRLERQVSEGDDDCDCAVCKEVFEAGQTAVCLPCTHRFHEDCITPWLKTHNTCPVCRHALPTADDASGGVAAAAAPGAPGAAAAAPAANVLAAAAAAAATAAAGSGAPPPI